MAVHVENGSCPKFHQDKAQKKQAMSSVLVAKRVVLVAKGAGSEPYPPQEEQAVKLYPPREEQVAKQYPSLRLNAGG
jgi:hypothetical protein